MRTVAVDHPYYKVKELDRHTWCIADDLIEYMYVVEGSSRAALIDTGMGFPGLRGVVEQLTKKPLFVINTHGHLDHIGANGEFDEVYMNTADLAVMEQSSDPDFRRRSVTDFVRELGREYPPEVMEAMICLNRDVTVKPLADGQCFDLGGRRLEMIHTPGHTPGCMCVIDRQNQLLFSGDMVCTMGVMLSFDESLPVSEFLQTMEALKRRAGRDVRLICPGHHVLPIGPEYMDKYMDCARAVLALAGSPESPGDGEVAEKGTFGRYYRFNYEDIGLTYTDRTRR